MLHVFCVHMFDYCNIVNIQYGRLYGFHVICKILDVTAEGLQLTWYIVTKIDSHCVDDYSITTNNNGNKS